MKARKSFGYAYSSELAIVGRFTSDAAAESVLEILEDWVLTAQRASEGLGSKVGNGKLRPPYEGFLKKWSARHPGLRELGPRLSDFADICPCNGESVLVSASGREASIDGIRTLNVGGIVRLLLFLKATSVEVSSMRDSWPS